MSALTSDALQGLRSGECRERTFHATRSVALQGRCRSNPSAIPLTSRPGCGLRTGATEAEERHGLECCVEVGRCLSEQAREPERRLGNRMSPTMHHVQRNDGLVAVRPLKAFDPGWIVRAPRRQACHARTRSDAVAAGQFRIG
jgi:hypothetical protein